MNKKNSKIITSSQNQIEKLIKNLKKIEDPSLEQVIVKMSEGLNHLNDFRQKNPTPFDYFQSFNKEYPLGNLFENHELGTTHFNISVTIPENNTGMLTSDQIFNKLIYSKYYKLNLNHISRNAVNKLYLIFHYPNTKDIQEYQQILQYLRHTIDEAINFDYYSDDMNTLVINSVCVEQAITVTSDAIGLSDFYEIRNYDGFTFTKVDNALNEFKQNDVYRTTIGNEEYFLRTYDGRIFLHYVDRPHMYIKLKDKYSRKTNSFDLI